MIRWRRSGSLVLPQEFIPLAEETGLIVPMGEWVLRTACRENRAWQEKGLVPICVSVNLSARQFQQPDLVETIYRILMEVGLHPQYLEVEITESTAMRDPDLAAAVMRDLRGMGVRISIDDFGTGYSSLSYLKTFPIDKLKIDRSFISELTTDVNDAAIAVAVIAMAHSLNLKVVAEGVEREEQLAFLIEHGCDELQGYLLAKPMTASAVEHVLKQKRTTLLRVRG